ncbi:MAG: hypothetical protein ACJ77A_01880 [Actinomycetota bacterium]
MIRRTSINLDQDLVRRAAEALGTSGITQTVHQALDEAVRRNRLAQLVSRDFSELSGQRLDALRRPRQPRPSAPRSGGRGRAR